MNAQEIDIDTIETSDPTVLALVDRIRVLEGAKAMPHELSFEENFANDLRLTKIGRAGGRRRDRIARGHAKTYDMLMERVGDQINEHIQKNGFTMGFFTALIRAYYSDEARAYRK